MNHFLKLNQKGAISMSNRFPFNTIQEFPALSQYQCRAEVDWVTIRITTSRTTNFMAVRTALGSILNLADPPHAKPLDEGPGRAATIFDIRLQDPKNQAWLTGCLGALETEFGFLSPPQVVNLEVSVDFYSLASDRSELVAMTLRLMQGIFLDRKVPRQFIRTRPDGSNEMRFLSDDDTFIDPLDTFYAGNHKFDPVAWRLYLKETDNKLPIQDVTDHRARMEIALQGTGLNPHVSTLNSLGSFRFQRLAKKFSCRRLLPLNVDGMSPLQKLLAERKHKLIASFASAGQTALGKSKRRKVSRYTCADRELNTLVRGGLRRLTDRFGDRKTR